MSARTVLAVSDLTAAYGNATALHGVSLEVREGETVALIGANGAGKSTTLRTISGLLAARSGRIAWEGKDITNWPADRVVAAGLSHCPEERHVWPEMTVEENLRLGGYLCGSRREVDRRAALAFGRFPRLQERAGQLAGTLSGGEQQMLAIARALMSEPRLLMLDEPSLGLSPKMAEDVFAVVRDINRHGVTVLLVEQNVHNALSVASRAYVLETGRVTAERNAGDLRDDPDLLRTYLGG
ncbi:ABC transporter ATP-binding protein [Methylobacterium frigidaeris]|uniref:High-affinity branched-chain amino acid transport ATP-binding protein LivF n=1 Tax=Methylobacterium frigidaeris TaxID=2038277 RepID=A0AA37M7C4_9HYPH|nr:ABC transporter ATP-binding protein [Methylobacterium frigidaeris]PIK71633.1 ABC transporter ATP-binding protein [Methylobacterium frigidaeris]GJD64481.1 High-affinity branched-chain amino acid transport ATP-binding protein LivF [Methylobacterium frigidaeris]